MTAPQAALAPGVLAAAMVPDLIAIIGHLAAQAGEESQPTALTSPAGQVPGVVKVRLSGARADIETAAAALAARWEVLDRSGPRPNRYDPGERVYLTIAPAPPRKRITAPDAVGRNAGVRPDVRARPAPAASAL